MSKKQPTPPPPPDYAAANEAAINADLATLPQRRLIEAQARLGEGQFAGLGDADLANRLFLQDLANAPQAAQGLLDIQQRFGPAFAQQARESLQATDPTGFALRDQLGGRLGAGTNTLEGLYTPTFDPQAYLNRYPDLRQAVAGMSPDEQNRWATGHWQQNGRAEGREGLTALPGQAAPSYEQFAGNGPDLARLGGGPDFATVGRTNLADTGQAAAGRGMLESQIFDQLALAGSPDAALTRSAEQAARARGAARGNILGDSSALQEALAVQNAQRGYDAQRRNDALGLLQSGQTTSDTRNRLALAQQDSDLASAGFNNATAQQGFQNRAAVVGQGNDAANQAFQNAMSVINQRNQSKQNTFGAQQGVLAQQAGGRQQDLANIQSFLGLQPIVSQGAQLSGLQQGAAPFVQNSYNGMNVNPNAGAHGAAFAGNIFGTQAGMYGRQLENSGNPLGSILGAFGGAIGGPLGGAIGSGIGGLFGGRSAGSRIGAGIGSCHIAREVYGETNPKWVLFFAWKEFHAPAWFRWLYNRFSRPVAAMIRPLPAVKNLIRRWMDTKIRGL